MIIGDLYEEIIEISDFLNELFLSRHFCICFLLFLYLFLIIMVEKKISIIIIKETQSEKIWKLQKNKNKKSLIWDKVGVKSRILPWNFMFQQELFQISSKNNLKYRNNQVNHRKINLNNKKLIKNHWKINQINLNFWVINKKLIKNHWKINQINLNF